MVKYPLICFLFFISCNWFGPHPITFLTNAIAKGCGFRLHRVGAFLLHNKIPSIHFGCTTQQQKLHRNDIVCATENMKSEVGARWIFDEKKEKLHHRICHLVFRTFHCSCVGQRNFLFFPLLQNPFYTMKSSVLIFSFLLWSTNVSICFILNVY
jgi:hypothetical protein